VLFSDALKSLLLIFLSTSINYWNNKVPILTLLGTSGRRMGEWSGGIAPPFLNLPLDRGEWSVSRPGRFTSGERATNSHLIGIWVSTRAGLDRRKKFVCPSANRTLATQPIDPRYFDSAILNHKQFARFHDIRHIG
jgi:hypothetical protein